MLGPILHLQCLEFIDDQFYKDWNEKKDDLDIPDDHYVDVNNMVKDGATIENVNPNLP